MKSEHRRNILLCAAAAAVLLLCAAAEGLESSSGPCLLLAGTGAYLFFRTGFIRVLRPGYVWKHTAGRVFRNTERRGKEPGTMTPWQALCTSVGGTVGTGNIAGVAGAILTGGPGAVFWMWAAALVGMATKYAEILLAVHFREKNSRGEWVGGPMYYIPRGMGKGWGWLGTGFALFGAAAAFGIGAMTQTSTVAESLCAAAGTGSTALRLAAAVCTGLLLGAVLFGGVERIGRVTEAVVPVMSAFYIVFALWAVAVNIRALPSALESIFRGAFCGRAVLGGAGGFAVLTAMKAGVGRGVFSNEAGLGSAPIAHAAASETNPVKQALSGIFEVFADTFVICTLTALVLLCSGAVPWEDSSLSGMEAAVMAFGAVYGRRTAGSLLTAAILFFALSSCLTWAFYGSRCWDYLFRGKGRAVYRGAYILAAAAGACAETGLVWETADVLNGFMAVPNLLGLLALSGTVKRLTEKYGPKKGKNEKCDCKERDQSVY